MENRVCKRCRQEKPLTDFIARKNKPMGRGYHCKACEALRKKESRDANPEKERARYRRQNAKRPKRDPMKSREYYEKNRPKILEQKRNYYWGQADPVVFRRRKNAISRAAYYRDVEKSRMNSRAYAAAYHARKRQAEGRYTAEDVRGAFRAQDGKCFWCKAPLVEFHVDHIHPLSKGGSNGPENICCACVSCNTSKCDLLPSEFEERLALRRGIGISQ